MKKPYITLIITLFVFFSMTLNGQILQSDTVFNQKKFKTIVGVESGLVVSSLTFLSFAWYSGYDQSKFHFFNDGAEFKGMDKLGHFTTSYFTGKVGYDCLRFSGVSKKKSLIYGGGIGLAYLSLVEVLDGFSSEWGFSPYDILANSSGTALFISQEAIWNEQRISMKYSFHQTVFPQYRPNLLGKNLAEQMLKDYNGQTYWLSANIYSFLPKDSRFPKWLNVACGYGANGMLGSFDNPKFYNGNRMPDYDRYSQFYLTLDIDWTKIKVRNKYVKSLLELFSFVKMPFPTLEFNKNGIQGHYLYF